MAPVVKRDRRGVAWAATGVVWAFLFFAGPDQVFSNTFIHRRPDRSAAPDSLFQYVAEHHGAIGALLIALTVANILFVLFAAYLAYRLAPTARPRWLPTAVVVVAALVSVSFWYADLATALIWFAAPGSDPAGYRWISPSLDRVALASGPVLGAYVGLVAYLLGRNQILPGWVRWFSWAVAVLAAVVGAVVIATTKAGPGGPLAFVAVLLWAAITSGAAIWSARHPRIPAPA